MTQGAHVYERRRMCSYEETSKKEEQVNNRERDSSLSRWIDVTLQSLVNLMTHEVSFTLSYKLKLVSQSRVNGHKNSFCYFYLFLFLSLAHCAS